MALSGITVNVSSNGLGRRTTSKDKISALLWFIANANLPAGFTTTAREKKVYSLAEAEALGITSINTNTIVLWYHIKQYFRMQPEGELWIGLYDVPAGAYAFTEIATLMNAAQGEIRNLGVYANLLDFASAQVTTIQAIMDAQALLGNRASCLYAPNFPGATNWSTIADLRALAAPRVTVVTGQDGGGQGATLFASKTFSITSLGAELGAISRATVQQSIGNPANFNVSDGIEFETLAMASGALISSLGLTVLGAVKDKGYSVMRKYLPRISGSYFERVPTAVAATNDYAWIEAQRTIDKAIRDVETALTPQLQVNVPLNSDGTLKDDFIGYLSDIAGSPLIDMKAAGEISDFKVLIDPAQNVLSTSRVTITIKILPVGVAEFITLNIGFTTAL